MTIEELHDIINCDESYRIERTISTSKEAKSIRQELFDNLQPNLQPQFEDIPVKVKQLIFSMDVYVLDGKQMLERYTSCNHLATHLATRPTSLTRQAFSKSILKPALESGYVKMLYPDKPTSRNQINQRAETRNTN